MCIHDAHRTGNDSFMLISDSWLNDFVVYAMLLIRCFGVERCVHIYRSLVRLFIYLYTSYSVHAYRVDSIPYRGSKTIKQIRLGWIVDRIGCILLRCYVLCLSCLYFVCTWTVKINSNSYSNRVYFNLNDLSKIIILEFCTFFSLKHYHSIKTWTYRFTAWIIKIIVSSSSIQFEKIYKSKEKEQRQRAHQLKSFEKNSLN